MNVEGLNVKEVSWVLQCVAVCCNVLQCVAVKQLNHHIVI